MTIQRKVQKTVRRWADKAGDPALRRQAQAAIREALAKGKAALQRFEKELAQPQTQARLEDQWRTAKADFKHLKAELKLKERQAVAFAKRKPEQALALATAVGLAGGIMVAALRRRKA